MTALERLTLTFMQIPMTEDRRMELHKRVKEAEEEQGELVAALRLLDRVTADKRQGITQSREDEAMMALQIGRLLARFPTSPTGLCNVIGQPG